MALRVVIQRVAAAGGGGIGVDVDRALGARHRIVPRQHAVDLVADQQQNQLLRGVQRAQRRRHVLAIAPLQRVVDATDAQ